MTPAKLAELEEKAKSATPDWVTSPSVISRVDPGYFEGFFGSGPCHASYWERGENGKHVSGEPQAKMDAEYIAAAQPKTILELIAYVRELEASISAIKSANVLNEWADMGAKLKVAEEALKTVVKHEQAHLEVNPDVHRHDRYRENMYETVRAALAEIRGGGE